MGEREVITEPGPPGDHQPFDDALADRIFESAPYALNEARRPRNVADGHYRRGGDELLLQVTEREGGLAATFDVGLQID